MLLGLKSLRGKESEKSVNASMTTEAATVNAKKSDSLSNN